MFNEKESANSITVMALSDNPSVNNEVMNRVRVKTNTILSM